MCWPATRAGFQALEVWAAKVDRYLEDHSPRELSRLFTGHGLEVVSVNSIEFIGFRKEQYPEIRERCKTLCTIAEVIGCRTLVVVPSPTPRRRRERGHEHRRPMGVHS